MFIKLGEWLPDVAAINNPGLIDVLNMVPTVDGYMSIRANKNYSTMPAGTTTLKGGISTTNDGVVEDFCGDADDLYRLTWDGSGNDIITAKASKSSNAYSAASFWDFTQYGETVIAVNGGTSGADTPQVITLGSANFADLGGSPPKAKTITTIKDFVVVGHTYDGTDGEVGSRVRWSGISNSTSWPNTPSERAATQSDQQDLKASDGNVQRICGGDDGFIVTENAVYLMEYEGPPTVFRIRRIAGIGATNPESVVRRGGAVYFWSHVGPVAVGRDGQIKYLAEGKCSDYLRQNVTVAAEYKPWGFFDEQYDAIVWDIAALFNLYYFPAFGRFTKINDGTNTNLGAIWSSRLVQTSDNIISAPLFFSVDRMYSRSHTSEIQKMEFKTGGVQLFKGKRGLLKEARMIASTSISWLDTAVLQCLTINNPPFVRGVDLGYTDYTSLTKNNSADDVFQGFFEGRYHFFRGTIESNSTGPGVFISEIEITDATPTGRY